MLWAPAEYLGGRSSSGSTQSGSLQPIVPRIGSRGSEHPLHEAVPHCRGGKQKRDRGDTWSDVKAVSFADDLRASSAWHRILFDAGDVVSCACQSPRHGQAPEAGSNHDCCRRVLTALRIHGAEIEGEIGRKK
eukprot:1779205-Rhodomonas_salina.3